MTRAFVLGCMLVLGSACGSSAACGRDEPARVQVAEPTPPVAEPDEPAHATEPTTPVDPIEPPPAHEPAGPEVVVGSCDVGWLPADIVTDVPAQETESLAETMRAWLAEGAMREVFVDRQRGVAFAKSEDDLGADPPYPTHTQAQSELVCGVSSRWLTDHVRARFSLSASPDMGGVTCEKNVCCTPGMEFVSNAILVARRTTVNDEPRWTLDAYVEIAQAALGEEYVERNRRYVSRELTRHRRRTCPGEPPGIQ